MDSQDTGPTDAEAEFYGDLTDVLMTLADVLAGDSAARATTDRPPDHPLGALVTHVNELISSLGHANERVRELEGAKATKHTSEPPRDLTMPVLHLLPDVVCLTLFGSTSNAGAAAQTNALLDAVARHEARYAIVDVTALEVVDGAAARTLERIARAVHLLGAECVLAGIGPSSASALLGADADLDRVTCRRTLADAMMYALRDER